MSREYQVYAFAKTYNGNISDLWLGFWWIRRFLPQCFKCKCINKYYCESRRGAGGDYWTKIYFKNGSCKITVLIITEVQVHVYIPPLILNKGQKHRGKWVNLSHQRGGRCSPLAVQTKMYSIALHASDVKIHSSSGFSRDRSDYRKKRTEIHKQAKQI